MENIYLGWCQLATAVATVRRLDFAECSVEMRMRWLLGFVTVLSVSLAEVGHADIGYVGSVAMICVPGFDCVVSGSVLSHDSVVIEWLGVIGTALMGRLLGVGTCIGSVDMRCVPVFDFVVSVSVSSVDYVAMG